MWVQGGLCSVSATCQPEVEGVSNLRHYVWHTCSHWVLPWPEVTLNHDGQMKPGKVLEQPDFNLVLQHHEAIGSKIQINCLLYQTVNPEGHIASMTPKMVCPLVSIYSFGLATHSAATTMEAFSWRTFVCSFKGKNSCLELDEENNAGGCLLSIELEPGGD